MTLFHGVNIQEVPTAIIPPRVVSASIPFVVGTAPVHTLTGSPAGVTNVPILCNTYGEFVAQLGYSTNWGKYNLEEFAYAFFALYGVGPVIFVNVLDPSADATAVEAGAHALVGGSYTIAQDVVPSTLVITVGETPAVLGVDYTVSQSSANGYLTITRISTSAVITTDTTSLTIAYSYIPATPVTSSDIIGSQVANANTGLWLIENVYQLFAIVPGLIVSPGWSQLPSVAAAMVARCQQINSMFRCFALTDVDSSSDGAPLYTGVNAWKNSNNYVSPDQAVCWPKIGMPGSQSNVGVSSGVDVYWMSSHLAGRIAATDADNNGIPFASPSNKPYVTTQLMLADNATQVNLTIPDVDILNQQGVVTGNQLNGWKCWGNRTGAYPGDTDPKDAFIPIRRMMDWVGNNVVLLLWQFLDDPVNARTVDTAVDSVNQWLNGLIGQGALLAGSLQFLASDNSAVSLSNGQLTLRLSITPPAPAEQINVILSYDVSGNSAVFS